MKILEGCNYCIFCKRLLSSSHNISIDKQICPECLKIIDISVKNDFTYHISVFAQDLKKFIVKIIHMMKTFNYCTIILYGERNTIFTSIFSHYLHINNITKYLVINYTEQLPTHKINSEKVIQVGIGFAEHINMINSKILLQKSHFKTTSLLFYQYDCDTIIDRFMLLKNGIQWTTSQCFDIWFLPIEIVLELRSSIIEIMDSIQNEYELYIGKTKIPINILEKHV